jgi:hypothetical protein
VVSTRLAFTDHETQGIAVADDSQGFLAAIEQQLQRGKLDADEARLFVGDNTWHGRTRKMLQYIASTGAVR